MDISLYEKTEDEGSMSGGPELWVRVLTNEQVDLPRVKAGLKADQIDTWSRYAGKPSDFYPHFVTAEERAIHGYRYEDWFIFPKVSD